MTTVLCVNAGSKGTDWNLQPPPVCRGGCRDKTGLKWYPERAKGHAEILANKKEIQEQFKQAIDKEGDHENACFCLCPFGFKF
eukprot:1160479-Pelagomonas_calceolata.AAC.18